MTNLLAYIVITLVTNTTERFPTHDEPYFESSGSPGIYLTDALYRAHQMPDKDPKVKWVRTTVKEITLAKFELDGPQEKVLSERIVSDIEVEQRLVRVESWTPSATNDVRNTVLFGNQRQRAAVYVYDTNGISYFK